MRSFVIAIALAAACSSGGKEAEPKAKAQPKSSKRQVAPTVSLASLLASDDSAPPLVVIIDDAGVLHLAAVNSWPELAAKDPLVGAKAVGDLDTLYKIVMEAFYLGMPPKLALAELEERIAHDPDPSSEPIGRDDPPPPEDDEPDLEDEVPQAARKEGQYKMKRATPPEVDEARKFTGERGRLQARSVAPGADRR